ncbi:MAG: helicase-related protein [Methylocella sp.]
MLASHGNGGDRLGIIHGGMDQKEREKVKAAFQTNPKDADVRILLATDAVSEGIDLQNYCNCLIHVEIPYNPNVMEQRNGRIDRHGQKYDEVLIWHPVDGGEATEDTFGGHKDDIIRALIKLEAMREDMGSVNPVIAPQMAGLIEGTNGSSTPERPRQEPPRRNVLFGPNARSKSASKNCTSGFRKPRKISI